MPGYRTKGLDAPQRQSIAVLKATVDTLSYMATKLENEGRCIAGPLDRMPQRAD